MRTVPAALRWVGWEEGVGVGTGLVCMRLWWMWNDPERNGECDYQRPEAFNDNLRNLVALLDHEEDGSRLMAIEGLRELGEHEEAARLLDHEFPEGFEPHIEVIRNANNERDTALHEIA